MVKSGCSNLVSGGRDSQSGLLRKFVTMLDKRRRDLFGKDKLLDLDRRKIKETVIVTTVAAAHHCDRRLGGAKKETFLCF